MAGKTQFRRNPLGVVTVSGEPPVMTPEEAGAEIKRRAAQPRPFLPPPGQPAALRPVRLPECPRADPAELRQHLRQCQSELRIAKAKAAKMADALERAAALIDDAQAKLATYAGLEAEVAAHHAGQIRDDTPMTEVPGGLAARLEQREECQATLKRLEAAKAQLAAENEQALQAVARCEASVSAAVELVVAAETERLADRVQALEAERREMLSKLAGARMLYLGVDARGSPAPLPLSMRVKSILTNAEQPLQVDPRWQAFARALREDPESTLGD